MQQLLDADIAAPLARQLIGEVPAGLAAADAATFLRTLLSQRLRIANGIDALPAHGKMRLLAFVGTTGVGKTTTIAKLTARYALMERRKVGVMTLDTQRIGAAEQLQKYGEILRVPVKVAHDKLELIQHLERLRRRRQGDRPAGHGGPVAERDDPAGRDRAICLRGWGPCRST